MPASLPRLLLLDGSLRGAAGNTGAALAAAARHAAGRALPTTVALGDYAGSHASLVATVGSADALLLGSGVYWGAAGSPLQRFFEAMTAHEAAPPLWGKPAAMLVTMDSVGGTEVAARSLGALNLLGCWVPPLGCVVLSRAAALAAAAAPAEAADLWQPEDVAVLVDNLLLAAVTAAVPWRRWTVAPTRAPRGRYPAPGLLDVDRPPWAEDGSA